MSNYRDSENVAAALRARFGGLFKVHTGPGCGGHTSHGIDMVPRDTSDTTWIAIRFGREVVALGPKDPERTGPTGHPLASVVKEYPRRQGRGWIEKIIGDVFDALDWIDAVKCDPNGAAAVLADWRKVSSVAYNSERSRFTAPDGSARIDCDRGSYRLIMVEGVERDVHRTAGRFDSVREALNAWHATRKGRRS